MKRMENVQKTSFPLEYSTYEDTFTFVASNLPDGIDAFKPFKVYFEGLVQGDPTKGVIVVQNPWSSPNSGIGGLYAGNEGGGALNLDDLDGMIVALNAHGREENQFSISFTSADLAGMENAKGTLEVYLDPNALICYNEY